ncbi:MAG: radical SAM protein [Candidatus Aenigmatarchaeota archaeon]
MDSNEKKSHRIETLYPHHCVWEITRACNMRCIHCGSSAGPLTKRPDELNTQEALDVINQLKEIGTIKVTLSGGEPFLRADWETLAKEVVRLNMFVSFISNGFLLNEDIAGRIKRLNENTNLVRVVCLSIDGDEKTHDYIRQTKGSFDKVTQAMETLRDSGLNTSVITQVNKLNLKLLPKIRDNIFKYNNIVTWQVQVATPFGRLAEDPTLLLNPGDYLELVNFIAEQKSIFGSRIRIAHTTGSYTESEPMLIGWDGCWAGLKAVGITSNGGVTGCLSLQEPRFIEGNVRTRRLAEIWYDPNFASYNRNFREELLEGYCKECDHRIKCRGGCKNTAYSFSGSLHNNFYCAHRISLGEVPKEIKSTRTSGCGQYHP